jgi:small subunit ribosomal protein S1
LLTEPEPYLEDMEQLLKEAMPLNLREGDTLSGVVVRIDRYGILISIGNKSEGIVPLEEMQSLTKSDIASICPGDSISVTIIDNRSMHGECLLSVDQANLEIGWHVLVEKQKNSEPISGIISGQNRGGLIVIVEKINGFIPISHINWPNKFNEEDRQEILSKMIGESVQLKILELDFHSKSVILSEKLFTEEKRKISKDKMLQSIKEGTLTTGTISGITEFGAFVDLGGADGLIHVSEISWSPVDNIGDFVKIGDTLDVYVLKVDLETERIGLSLKRIGAQPWDGITQKYQINQTVDGTITKLTKFGAFARISGNIEGLIHISELSDKLIDHPKEVIHEGDVVPLRILNIEPERKRLALSLKQADLG